MYVHGAAVAEVVKPPHLVQQLIAGEYPVGGGGQVEEKLQLFGRSVHPLAVHQQLIGVQIDDQLVKGELALRRLIVISETAQHGVNAGQHLLHFKRLGDVVVGAHLQTGHLILQLALGGEHDDGDFGGLPDLLAHGPAVHAGQHNVQQHQIRLELVEFLQTGQTVSRDFALHLFLFQIDAQQVGNILIVFHNQYLCGHTVTPL